MKYPHQLASQNGGLFYAATLCSIEESTIEMAVAYWCVDYFEPSRAKPKGSKHWQRGVEPVYTMCNTLLLMYHVWTSLVSGSRTILYYFEPSLVSKGINYSCSGIKWKNVMTTALNQTKYCNPPSMRQGPMHCKKGEKWNSSWNFLMVSAALK